MVFFLFWAAVFLGAVSPQRATPPLQDLFSGERPAQRLIYSYSSTASISRGIRANLSADVSPQPTDKKTAFGLLVECTKKGYP